jgi:hypothetical protein
MAKVDELNAGIEIDRILCYQFPLVTSLTSPQFRYISTRIPI